MAKGARSDSPTGTGNTVGTIVGQPKRAKRSPTEANPPVKSETPQESQFQSHPRVKREFEWLQKLGKWRHDFSHEIGEAFSHPGEGVKGGFKGGVNLLSDGLSFLLNNAHSSNELKPIGYSPPPPANIPTMSIDNDAQKGGEHIVNLVALIFPGTKLPKLGKASELLKATEVESDLIRAAGKGRSSSEVINIENTGAKEGRVKNIQEGGSEAEQNGTRIEGNNRDNNSNNPKKKKENEKDSANQSDQDHPSECKGGSCGKGEPVDIASGDYLQSFSVIVIPGLLPITLTRTYRSAACLSGLLGRKWADDWSRQLVLDGEKVHFTDADGQVYDFSTPEKQVLARNRHLLHCLLTGELDGELCLVNKQIQKTFHFNHIVGNRRRLSAITDRHQNHIQFIYNDQHQLMEVVRNDGFRLTLHYQDNQLQTVDYHFQQIQQCLVTCHYDQHGYLAECDAFQQNHLWHEYTA
ncbi:DUF6531 domain-containing protein [Xenorhabdus bovienii]|uniref:DUF6531 domain-containing protein n=1 Tax=Xenorhabdus bovienii TaxID=40576 RepID=UPI001EDEA08C|nr:DUF6531 domain-containing protein [Xenorhabdus bovienii]MCG3469066.1 DUF6531 domain-containing protein [Xenorhabdus bovienii]